MNKKFQNQLIEQFEERLNIYYPSSLDEKDTLDKYCKTKEINKDLLT